MKTRAAVASALTLFAAVAFAGCASGDAEEGSPQDHSSPSGQDHSSPSGQDQSSPSGTANEVNDADVTFATMMIPHHEQAIEMSDSILDKKGVDQRVVDLAEDIKSAQGPEIEQLQGWLGDWGGDPGEHPGEHPDGGTNQHGNGMMSKDDMAALEAVSGKEASTLFLEQMIVHHEGAVEMARAQIDDGRNPAATDLAQTIIDTQTREIQQMRGILVSL